jgi:hypothetical protein
VLGIVWGIQNKKYWLAGDNRRRTKLKILACRHIWGIQKKKYSWGHMDSWGRTKQEIGMEGIVWGIQNKKDWLVMDN